MRRIEQLRANLGAPYAIKRIDGEDTIYRSTKDYEFEVSGVHTNSKHCTLYVWTRSPRKIVGIYKEIPVDDLKDILGYFVVKYQNLLEKIHPEREA